MPQSRPNSRFSAAGLAAALAVLLPGFAGAAEPSPMVRISGGAYTIGAGVTGAAAPIHKVQLQPFMLDRYEVSNAQFADFLNTLRITAGKHAGPGQVTSRSVSGADARRVWGGSGGTAVSFIELDDSDARIVIRGGKFAAATGFADRPVTEATWRGALAYCRWRGLRLPTEAEWEAAARGLAGRIYPWGNDRPDRARAHFARPRGQTAPVTSHKPGATPEGVHHMAGNLAEWTSSLFRPYPYRADDGREDQNSAAERVTRGGDYTFDAAPDRLTGTFRTGFSRAPARGHRHIGFRCAKTM
jgi:iron(II)-dependent oxidoreductase